MMDLQILQIAGKSVTLKTLGMFYPRIKITKVMLTVRSISGFSCEAETDSPDPECSEKGLLMESPEYCGLLRHRDGSPFDECMEEEEIMAGNYGEMCAFDVCAMEDDEDAMKFTACSFLAAVASHCRLLGYVIDWRSRANCCKCPASLEMLCVCAVMKSIMIALLSRQVASACVIMILKSFEESQAVVILQGIFLIAKHLLASSASTMDPQNLKITNLNPRLLKGLILSNQRCLVLKSEFL